MNNKFVQTLLILLVMNTASFAQGRLEVVVKNIKSNKGSIRIGLFDNEKDFLNKPVMGRVVKAISNEVTVVIENITPGDYAISIFHDENDNEKLDSNFFGIPKEGFAFGNNAMGAFGPPSFNKAKVKIEAGKTSSQTINLKYL